jgi:hypothetical protein
LCGQTRFDRRGNVYGDSQIGKSQFFLYARDIIRAGERLLIQAESESDTQNRTFVLPSTSRIRSSK